MRGAWVSRRALLGASLALGPALAAASRALDATPSRAADGKRIKANGITLNVIEEGSGPAVLFCHGFPDTSETWGRQLRALASAGYRAIALDMRGYGLSDAPADPRDYTTLQTTGDMVAVLDALEVRSAVLVGHDWGAAHVWQAMMYRPDRFRAAVGISIPFGPRGAVSYYDTIRQQGLADRYYAFALMRPEADARWQPAAKTIPGVLYWCSASAPEATRWGPFDPTFDFSRPLPVALPRWADPAYVAHQVRAFERTGFDGGLNYYRAAQLDFELTAAWKRAVIRQPTLFVFGKDDKLTASFHNTGAALRQGLPGLVAQVGFEDCGHWVQHEAADRLNTAIIDFLRQIGPPG